MRPANSPIGFAAPNGDDVGELAEPTFDFSQLSLEHGQLSWDRALGSAAGAAGSAFSAPEVGSRLNSDASTTISPAMSATFPRRGANRRKPPVARNTLTRRARRARRRIAVASLSPEIR